MSWLHPDSQHSATLIIQGSEVMVLVSVMVVTLEEDSAEDDEGYFIY